jgi:hypothetical protein
LAVDLDKGFYVQYYRCDLCDHVWSLSSLITDVPRETAKEKTAREPAVITTPRTRRRRIN